MGTLAGAGIAGTIGKMGLVAPKMLDAGIHETPSQAIDRQESRIDWQSDYIQALTDLTLVDLKWVDLELELRAATVEDELQALKQKIKEIPNGDFRTNKDCIAFLVLKMGSQQLFLVLTVNR